MVILTAMAISASIGIASEHGGSRIPDGVIYADTFTVRDERPPFTAQGRYAGQAMIDERPEVNRSGRQASFQGTQVGLLYLARGENSGVNDGAESGVIERVPRGWFNAQAMVPIPEELKRMRVSLDVNAGELGEVVPGSNNWTNIGIVLSNSRETGWYESEHLFRTGLARVKGNDNQVRTAIRMEERRVDNTFHILDTDTEAFDTTIWHNIQVDINLDTGHVRVLLNGEKVGETRLSQETASNLSYVGLDAHTRLEGDTLISSQFDNFYVLPF